MPKVVLIHTQLGDQHSAEVQRHLSSLGVHSTTLFRERCFQDWTISGEGDALIVDVGSNGRWAADAINAVLWRRDYLVEPSWVKLNNADSSASFFVANQRSFHVKAAFLSLARNVPFINHPAANEVAWSKHLQMRLARGCGLLVPATYIGSDSTLALNFARRLWETGRRCCTKNLESIPLELDGVEHVRLTKLFNESDIAELDGLAICPMIFQEYVEKKCEYRVTIVGQEVFACRIDSQSAGGKTATDWRHYNFSATPHHTAELPVRVRDGLVQLVAALGLTYGAADMVENPAGEFYFLELNSTGQWLWIEQLTDLPISMAIARHLANPSLIHAFA